MRVYEITWHLKNASKMAVCGNRVQKSAYLEVLVRERWHAVLASLSDESLTLSCEEPATDASVNLNGITTNGSYGDQPDPTNSPKAGVWTPSRIHKFPKRLRTVKDVSKLSSRRSVD